MFIYNIEGKNKIRVAIEGHFCGDIGRDCKLYFNLFILSNKNTFYIFFFIIMNLFLIF